MLVLITLFSACQSSSSSSPGLVEISINTEGFFYSRASYQIFYHEENGSITIPLGDCSLIEVGPKFGYKYLYKESEGEKLDLKFINDILYVNGNPRSIDLASISAENFNQLSLTLTEEEILQLQNISMLDIPERKLDSVFSRLTYLVEKNENITFIGYEDFEKGYRLMSMTKPEVFILDSLNQPEVLQQIDFSNLQNLLIGNIQSDILASDLPGIMDIFAGPSLKSVSFVSTRLASLNLFEQILDNCSNLSAVTVAGVMSPDVEKRLANHSGLRELHLINQVEGFNYFYENLRNPNIRYLTFLGENYSQVIEGIDNLAHLNIGPVSFRNLEQISSSAKGLEYLKILSPVNSVKPLANAGNIQQLALLIDSTNQDLNTEPLGEMGSLRGVELYVPDESFSNSPEAEELKSRVQAACPSCEVTINRGFCLGKGHLLFFLLTFSGFLLFKYRQVS